MGEDGGAYKTREDLASQEMMLEDMNTHFWEWPQHDVNNESEWLQSMAISRRKARRAFEKSMAAVRVANRKAKERIDTEKDEVEYKGVWNWSEINTVAEGFHGWKFCGPHTPIKTLDVKEVCTIEVEAVMEKADNARTTELTCNAAGGYTVADDCTYPGLNSVGHIKIRRYCSCNQS